MVREAVAAMVEADEGDVLHRFLWRPRILVDRLEAHELRPLLRPRFHAAGRWMAEPELGERFDEFIVLALPLEIELAGGSRGLSHSFVHAPAAGVAIVAEGAAIDHAGDGEDALRRRVQPYWIRW